jgi:hypothetical protein
MTPKSKKALIVIVSLLAIGGGVGYFLWKRKKDKVKAEEEAKAKADAEAKAKADAEANANTNTNTNTNQGGSPTGYTFPFTNVTEGNAFRGWVNKTYPDYAKSIKLDPTGTLNSFVQKAWDKHGAEYTKSIAPKTSPTTTQTFNDAWNTAKSLKVPSFIWNGKPYDTTSGKAYVDPRIIQVGDDVYAKEKLGGYAWNDGNWNSGGYYSGGSSSGNFFKDQLVGKVVSIKGKGLQVENTFKPMVTRDNSYETKFWVYAPFTTKVKPNIVQP